MITTLGNFLNNYAEFKKRQGVFNGSGNKLNKSDVTFKAIPDDSFHKSLAEVVKKGVVLDFKNEINTEIKNYETVIVKEWIDNIENQFAELQERIKSSKISEMDKEKLNEENEINKEVIDGELNYHSQLFFGVDDYKKIKDIHVKGIKLIGEKNLETDGYDTMFTFNTSKGNRAFVVESVLNSGEPYSTYYIVNTDKKGYLTPDSYHKSSHRVEEPICFGFIIRNFKVLEGSVNDMVESLDAKIKEINTRNRIRIIKADKKNK